MTTTRTYTILAISPAAYDEIRARLIKLGTGGTIDDRAGVIDMDGIFITKTTEEPDVSCKVEDMTGEQVLDCILTDQIRPHLVGSLHKALHGPPQDKALHRAPEDKDAA